MTLVREYWQDLMTNFDPRRPRTILYDEPRTKHIIRGTPNTYGMGSKDSKEN